MEKEARNSMAQIPERAPDMGGQLEADPDVSFFSTCPVQKVPDG